MKDHLKEVLGSFFIITTLICLAMFVLGLLFRPEQQFGYEAFLYPVVYGAIGSIPGFFMYTKKEMSIQHVIIRKMIQLLLLVIAFVVMIFAGSPVSPERIFTAAGVAVSVIVIFVCVHLIEWLLDRRTALKMTDDLKNWKENYFAELGGKTNV